MAKKGYECFSCEAAFKIKHDLDDHYYKVTYCSFCGEELTDEQEYDCYEDDIDS